MVCHSSTEPKPSSDIYLLLTFLYKDLSKSQNSCPINGSIYICLSDLWEFNEKVSVLSIHSYNSTRRSKLLTVQNSQYVAFISPTQWLFWMAQFLRKSLAQKLSFQMGLRE